MWAQAQSSFCVCNTGVDAPSHFSEVRQESALSAANLPGDGEVDAGFDSGDVGPISGPTKV